MAEQNNLTMVARVVDQATGPLRAIADALGGVGRKGNIKQLGLDFSDLRKHMEPVGRELKHVLVPVLGLFGITATSTAGALYGLAQSVSNFARQTRDLSNSSQVMGVSVRAIKEFQQVAGTVGIDPNRAMSGLRQFSRTMLEFKHNTEEAQRSFGDWFRQRGIGALFDKMMAATRGTNDSMAAMNVLIQEWGHIPTRERGLLAEKLFGSSDFALLTTDQLKRALQELGDVHVRDAESAQRFLIQLQKFHKTTGELKDDLNEGLIPSMTDLLKQFDEFAKRNASGAGEGIKEFFNNLLGMVNQTRKEFEALKREYIYLSHFWEMVRTGKMNFSPNEQVERRFGEMEPPLTGDRRLFPGGNPFPSQGDVERLRQHGLQSLPGGGARGPAVGPGAHGANFMHGQFGGVGENLVTVQTKAGPIRVNKVSADAMKSFVDGLVDAGAPIKSIGSFSARNIAGTNTPSQHAFGNAIDIDQLSRNVVRPEFLAWAKSHPDQFHELLRKNNIINGGDFHNPDFGHFEYAGPGPRNLTPNSNPITGTASTYNPFKPGFRSGGGQTASGEPYNPNEFSAAIQMGLRDRFGGVKYGKQPGMALVEVGGKKAIVKINDVGPLTPGRIIDLNESSMRFFDPSMKKGLLPNTTVTPLSPGSGFKPGPYDPDNSAATFADRFGSFSHLGDDRLYQALTNSVNVQGNARIQVDVNAPKGTKVKADADGLFKDVKLNRSEQMAVSSDLE